MQHLGERIKYITKKMNITQSDLAKILCKDKSLISKHLNNTRTITLEDFDLYVATIFKIDFKKEGFNEEETFIEKARELLKGTYQWEDPEYQKYTNFVPSSELPSKRRSTETEKVAYKKVKENSTQSNISKNEFLKGVSLGAAIVGTAGLAVNLAMKKFSKKS